MNEFMKGIAIVLALLSSILALGANSVVSAEDDHGCYSQILNNNPNQMVCSCSQDACGDINSAWPQEPGSVFIYESTMEGKRLAFAELDRRELLRSAHSSPGRHAPIIHVNVHMLDQKQPIMGWGGAFSDAFGMNIASLSDELQYKLLESYFGAKGLQYNFGRVPIGGTDFSNHSYSYDDSTEPDFDLSNWSLADEDYAFKMPYIKRALEMAKREQNLDVKLLASPWSAPAWMKTSRSLVRGHLIHEDRYYDAYARYLMKFFDAYRQEGINFWGATVQNEPVAASLPTYNFNSMEISNEEMIKFVGDFLGPALESRGYTKQNFKLMVGDDSLGLINGQVPQVLRDPAVQKYVAGLAFHWYTSGSLESYEKLTEVYNKIKNNIEFMIMTQASEGSSLFEQRVSPGSWERAEHYATDIIEDLNRGTNAWIDWNMALDIGGGPNWVNNFVDSAILVDANNNAFYKQPMYYSLAHFSRFFKPGSIRVHVTQDRRELLTVAVHNKETNHVVVNLLNKSGGEMVVKLALHSKYMKLQPFTVDRRSLTTVVIKL